MTITEIISYIRYMTNTITQHIEFLQKELGSYSKSAKFLGVDPRSYRHQREHLRMSGSGRRALVLGVKFLQLRRAIKILRDEYGVPAAQIRAACRKAKTIN